MDYYGVYLTLIISNLTFNHTLSYDLDHSYITLNHPIVHGFECFYEVMDILVVQV